MLYQSCRRRLPYFDVNYIDDDRDSHGHELTNPQNKIKLIKKKYDGRGLVFRKLLLLIGSRIA
jgi:hypothetical protein